MPLLIWAAELAGVGVMFYPHTGYPELLALLLVAGLVAGMTLACGDRGALWCVCLFGAGIDLMLAVWFGHAAEVGLPELPTGLAGVAAIAAGLLAAATGRG